MSFPSSADPGMPLDRARAATRLPAVPQAPPAGSLVLVDHFEDRYDGAAHGNVAAYSARQHGFRGAVYAEELGRDGEITNPAMRAGFARLSSPGQTDPAQTRQAIQDWARDGSRELLQNVTGDLEKIGATGLHHSAVNVSSGQSPRLFAGMVFNSVRNNLDPHSSNARFAQNLTDAYGVDRDKLANADRKISGPEQLKLRQGLLRDAQAGFSSPETQGAREEYRQAVRGLENNHNSVVVSAGNEGTDVDDWAREAGGLRVKEGANSDRSVLSVPEVTTVGATEWRRGAHGLRERVARYTSVGSDLYASGAVGNGQDPQAMNTNGTSFAAPRTGGAMATLHGLHRGLSSAQVETLTRNTLTHRLPDGHGGQADVLDYGRTSDLLSHATY